MLRTIKALLHIGGRIGVVESAIAYLLPVLFYISSATDLIDIFTFNFKCQLLLFLVMVQFPLAMTGKMAYVDLGCVRFGVCFAL